VNGRHFSVFNVHLKAGTTCERDRERELNENITIQMGEKSIDDGIILGDFNMRDVGHERNLKLEENYADLWKVFHGIPAEERLPEGQEGFTYNLEVNKLAKVISDIVSAIKGTGGYSSRFDRICFRSRSDTALAGDSEEDTRHIVDRFMGAWVVRDIALLGTEPIFVSAKDEVIFPSDHFGILVTLELKC